jgi:hypothetical protein
LTGKLDVSDGAANPTIGEIQITGDNWHYVTQDTKEDE